MMVINSRYLLNRFLCSGQEAAHMRQIAVNFYLWLHVLNIRFNIQYFPFYFVILLHDE